jgi:hypothetical protein
MTFYEKNRINIILCLDTSCFIKIFGVKIKMSFHLLYHLFILLHLLVYFQAKSDMSFYAKFRKHTQHSNVKHQRLHLYQKSQPYQIMLSTYIT